MAENDDNRLCDDEELSTLSEKLASMPFDNNYVAPPAPGYDTAGLWHCFEANKRSDAATYARGLGWVLDRELGIQTQLVPHRYMDIDSDLFPSDRSSDLVRWERTVVGKPGLLIANFSPRDAFDMSKMGPPVIPYFDVDSPDVSPDVVSLCNAADVFKKVWVTHSAGAQALYAAGVDEERVAVIPPLLCGGPWPKWRERPEGDGTFTFGSMGPWQTNQRAFEDIANAYFSMFVRGDNVLLSIRTHSVHDNDTVRSTIDRIKADLSVVAERNGYKPLTSKDESRPTIRLIVGAGTDEDVVDWLSGLDGYVDGSLGLGLRVPSVWAKAQGVPMIASSRGAVGDLLLSVREAGGECDDILEVQGHADLHSALVSAMTHLGADRFDEVGAAATMQAYGVARVRDAVREELSEVLGDYYGEIRRQ